MWRSTATFAERARAGICGRAIVSSAFDAVARKPLDFGLDWFAGLDIGGANWEVLYRNVDPNALPQRPITAFAAPPGLDLRQAYCEWRGSWLHEVGLDGDPSLKAKKREAVLLPAGARSSGRAEIGATMRLAVDTGIELCDGTSSPNRKYPVAKLADPTVIPSRPIIARTFCCRQ
ncbi:hypothetical protein ACVOMV_33905 [Mesorhizobium atlanticum]